ncbi:MAG: hypothetical protein ACOYJH_01490 [Anaerovoracaceae bacterium]|jgi:hypothetical protein
MELQELLEILEIGDPSDFEYFEDFAEIVEYDEEIPADTLNDFFSQADSDTVAELIVSYFEDLLDAIPDRETDMYMLLDNIKLELSGLAKNAEDEDGLKQFTDELYRFRQWYTSESEVGCTDRETGDVITGTLMDAVTLARLENVGQGEYDYDFSGCLDYELDEYIMDIAAMADKSDPDDILSEGYVPDDYDE